MPETNSTKTKILALLDQIKDILIAVATGGPRITDVNHEYIGLYNQLTRLLIPLEIENPIPYNDLWKWYGKWSSGDLTTYHKRRVYINELIKSLEDTIRDRRSLREIEITGWTRVDRAMDNIRNQLETASDEEQFQSIGLLCREVLLSLAEMVFDPDQHPQLEEEDVEPSPTDAKRMLDRYLGSEVAGGQNKFARKYAKASLDLANKLQHDRNASHRDAMLCAEATASVVNFIAIISGKRDPEAVLEQPPDKLDSFPF